MIVGKALERDAARRYDGAAALADDLRRYLRDETIVARPPTRSYQFRKFVRRNRGLAIGIGLAGAALVVGLVASLLSLGAARRAHELADAEALTARRAESWSHLRAAGMAIRSGRPWVASEALDAVGETDRRWTWALLAAQVEAWLDEISWTGPPPVLALAPDGTLTVATTAPAPQAADAAWSSTRHPAAVVDAGGRTLFAPRALTRVARWKRPGPVAPDGTAYFLGNVEETLWEVAGDTETPYPCFLSLTDALARSAGRTLLAAGDVRGRVVIWDRATRQPRHQLDVGASVTSLAFHPAGTHLAIGGRDGGVRIADLSDGHLAHALGHGGGPVDAVTFSHDGSLLVSVSGGRARSWAWAEVVPATVLRPHRPDALDPKTGSGPFIYGVAFRGDGRHVVSCGWDGTARVSDTRTGRLLATIETSHPQVRAVACSPDGEMLALLHSGPQAGCFWVDVWRLQTRERLWSQVVGRWAGEVLAFTADGRGLFCYVDERAIGVWDAVTGAVRWQQDADGLSMREARFTPDGRHLVIAGALELEVRDGPTGALARRVPRADRGAMMWQGLALGTWPRAAVAHREDDAIEVWDLARMAPVQSLEGSAGHVHTLLFSPDETALFSGGVDGRVRIWDLGRGRLEHTLDGHGDYVFQLACSPDGRTLASTGGDNTVRLWHTRPLRARWHERRRLLALEQRLHPEADRIFDGAAGPAAAVAAVDAGTWTDSERAVLLDRLLERTWEGP